MARSSLSKTVWETIESEEKIPRKIQDKKERKIIILFPSAEANRARSLGRAVEHEDRVLG